MKKEKKKMPSKLNRPKYRGDDFKKPAFDPIENEDDACSRVPDVTMALNRQEEIVGSLVSVTTQVIERTRTACRPDTNASKGSETVNDYQAPLARRINDHNDHLIEIRSELVSLLERLEL